MLNFDFCIPTNFIFGKDTHKRCGEIISNLNFHTVLLVYDGGTFLKDTGLLDAVLQNLKDARLNVLELTGVLPNPRLSLVYDGVNICKEKNVDIILALGGGSTIDTSKAIAAGAKYDGDVWDYFETDKPVLNALPLGVILTIAATGSESGAGTMITNENGWLKRGAGGPALRPAFSIMNPELTYSLPAYQTACGIADMYTHVAERYFSNTKNTYVIDAMCEGIFRSLKDIGPKLMENPKNYDYRAEIMWMGTIAHNDTVGIGRIQDWATHDMGHEISGIYDLTHAASMSIMLYAWMRYVYKHDLERFVRYAKYALEMHVEELDKEEIAIEAIEQTAGFMKRLGMPLHLSEVGIDDSKFEEMAKKALINKEYIGNFVQLKEKDIVAIYNLAK